MSTTGNIKDMHYDIKQKLNRLDTNKYVGLQIPQLDRKLNEALNLYILLVAEPRIKNQLGLEGIQRTTDDISILIVDNEELTISDNTNPKFTSFGLPADYLHYLSTAQLLATKGDCVDKELMTIVIRHNNRSNEKSFYDSNFEWGECNIRFFDNEIKAFKTDFTINKLFIDYIKTHPYMHNAEDFHGNGYVLPNGTALVDYQDCLLPDITHAEIVDLAVLLITGELELPTTFQLKQNILSTRQLITN